MLRHSADAETPSTELTDAIRVPRREEVSRLAGILSDKDRTVEIVYIPKGFQARLYGDAPNSFTDLPSGYMVNIHTRHPKRGFWTEDPNKTKGALVRACLKVGIDNPSIHAVAYTKDPDIEPHQGAFIHLETMQQLCAVAAKQGQAR